MDGLGYIVFLGNFSVTPQLPSADVPWMDGRGYIVFLGNFSVTPQLPSADVPWMDGQGYIVFLGNFSVTPQLPSADVPWMDGQGYIVFLGNFSVTPQLSSADVPWMDGQGYIVFPSNFSGMPKPGIHHDESYTYPVLHCVCHFGMMIILVLFPYYYCQNRTYLSVYNITLPQSRIAKVHSYFDITRTIPDSTWHYWTTLGY